MILKNKLNDPEYRWYHKDEITEMLKATAKEKRRLGIKIIKYDELRNEYLSKIKEERHPVLNWDRFKFLIDIVPKNLDCNIKKKCLQPKDMYHFERRDECKCYICGSVSMYTHFHHVVPNGGSEDNNIVTLCMPCHKMVHLALYAAGKTKVAI